MPAPKELDPSTSLTALYGAKLRKLRVRSGLTQRRLGDLIPIAHSRIAQYELARRTHPRTSTPSWTRSSRPTATSSPSGATSGGHRSRTGRGSSWSTRPRRSPCTSTWRTACPACSKPPRTRANCCAWGNPGARQRRSTRR
ncbi:helix-turn-helix domain-containing protein [Streptomyces sp. NBC_00670]|uniref:helix-turn-helix domain-containing protein n=1 Tax=Streptomyces sp. NBC_00670 TaxID=2975804 RepID=UPI002E30864F|nr:helix-turn-helix domain-containing protein [Streptomyces sp. NBC_00670]